MFISSWIKNKKIENKEIQPEIVLGITYQFNVLITQSGIENKRKNLNLYTLVGIGNEKKTKYI